MAQEDIWAQGQRDMEKSYLIMGIDIRTLHEKNQGR
jgi:hypothetical protein